MKPPSTAWPWGTSLDEKAFRDFATYELAVRGLGDGTFEEKVAQSPRRPVTVGWAVQETARPCLGHGRGGRHQTAVTKISMGLTKISW